MQTTCDKCKKHVKKVGRLSRVYTRGLTLRLCKSCKDKLKRAYR
ncbi:MAG TPA: hypothetical protein VI933_00215 [archaeon]|nr:hypothetical protein [archaeon]